jgi:protoporphyrinogen oxidase
MVLKARSVKDWRKLEDITASDWIRKMAGGEALEKVWWPLLEGKFGSYAKDISAVWFWNKLVLRGGSRGSGGKEVLAYYQGGFAALAEEVANTIQKNSGSVHLNTKVTSLIVEDNKIIGVNSDQQRFDADIVINTTPLPTFADLVKEHADNDYVNKLLRIRYLGNTCLTLVLDRSLSSTYWLNVTEPDFPFVGIIEHTNFEPTESYGGNHIVYLSKYLPTSDALYNMDSEETLRYSLPHIQKMFPNFREDWIVEHHVYKAEYSQPLVEKNYSQLIPDQETPIEGLFLCTMAQIYPEDRGTNYAIREGIKIANKITQ